MEKTYNIVELFSGIGSQAAALKNLGVKINTVGTSEWDVHAIVAYDMIHGGTDIPADIARMSKDELLEKMSHYTFSNSGKAPLEYEALRTYSVESLRYIYTSIKRNHNFVDISALEGKEMPDGIDILTYSFPCQDLSNVGAFHGYNKGIDKDSGSRSSLLWQGGRVLTEMKDTGKTLPRFLLIVITNPGSFLPQTVEAVLQPTYNPPFYRNQLLADAMVKFHMIDTATSGIKKVYRIQKEKFFPLPDYNLSNVNQVAVTVYGKILDEKYTQLLYKNNESLDLETVFYWIKFKSTFKSQKNKPYD